jgi:hypothetical protein
MRESITVPLKVVNILDKYHKNPFDRTDLSEIQHNANNLLEKCDKY